MPPHLLDGVHYIGKCSYFPDDLVIMLLGVLPIFRGPQRMSTVSQRKPVIHDMDVFLVTPTSSILLPFIRYCHAAVYSHTYRGSYWEPDNKRVSIEVVVSLRGSSSDNVWIDASTMYDQVVAKHQTTIAPDIHKLDAFIHRV